MMVVSQWDAYRTPLNCTLFVIRELLCRVMHRWHTQTMCAATGAPMMHTAHIRCQEHRGTIYHHVQQYTLIRFVEHCGVSCKVNECSCRSPEEAERATGKNQTISHWQKITSF